jgi:hypothetical protein
MGVMYMETEFTKWAKFLLELLMLYGALKMITGIFRILDKAAPNLAKFLKVIGIITLIIIIIILKLRY